MTTGCSRQPWRFFVLVCLSISVGLWSPLTASAQWEAVRERQGDPPQGYVQPNRMPGKNFVTDCHGKTLGWTTAEGTFTNQGQQIATIPMPGRLLEKSDCPSR
jgi:hypothetical protein